VLRAASTPSVNFTKIPTLYHPSSTLLISLPLRSKMWIKKNVGPEWDYKDKTNLLNVEFHSAFEKPEARERAKNIPFVIIDVRNDEEKKMIDLPRENSKGCLIPRIDFPFSQFHQYIPEEFPKNKYLIFVCQTGLASAQAARFFISKGYLAKILFGGLETLPGLI
jgi:rhodanese-related sulfurtransferase